MKKIFTFTILFIVLINPSFGIDQKTIDVLGKQGLQVKMGELTGAGSRFLVHDLAGLVLPDGILMKEDCSAIVVKNTINPKVSDIVKIKVQDQEIAVSEFVGFIVR